MHSERCLVGAVFGNGICINLLKRKYSVPTGSFNDEKRTMNHLAKSSVAAKKVGIQDLNC